MDEKIAVIGAGYWGKNLARNFAEIGSLKTICDSDELLADTYLKKYPDIHFTTSFQDVLADDEIKAVAIATPAVTHFNLASESLKAGKHVFIEKPLALNVEEGEQLIELADKCSRQLMVGHILQYHNAVIKLKELIDAGELGKVQYLCSNRLSIGKIRTEENILWSFAPHDISVILMLLEEEPIRVYATGGEYLQHSIADVTLTTMDFPSGTKAHIFVSWLHPFKEQKLVVIGDRKMAVFDDVSEDKLLLYPHQVNWLSRVPIANKGDAEPVQIDMAEPLKQECLHFLDCIKGNKRPKTDGREGLRVLKVLQQSQTSLNYYLGPNRNFVAQQMEAALPDQNFFVHESSYIDSDVHVGMGTKVWHFSHILSGTRIGDKCNIGQNVLIGPDVMVGNGCKIQNNVSVYKGIELEDDVFCGPSMVFTNIFNPRARVPRMNEVRQTLVKKGATLGANCTIVCGSTIGQYAFIGAGAVVIKDVPNYALMIGNPARQIGWMCVCGEKLEFTARTAECAACGLRYQEKDERIEPETK